MSITFSAVGAPTVTEPCPYCVEGREEGWITEPETCEPWCTGTQTTTTDPSVNFANGNAFAILGLLDFDTRNVWDGDGTATTAGDMRQRIMRARNGDLASARRDSYELEPGHAGTAVVHEDGLARIERRGPRVVGCGNTDEQTLRRLASLEALAIWCQDNGCDTISWS